MLTIFTYLKHSQHSVHFEPGVSLLGVVYFTATHLAVISQSLQRPADWFPLGENTQNLTSTAIWSLLHTHHLTLRYCSLSQVLFVKRFHLFHKDPRIHCFEKVIQTSYLGTDFPPVMIPICHLFLILCISMRKQNRWYTGYKWNSCTIQQLPMVFPYFQRTQIFEPLNLFFDLATTQENKS